MAQWARRVFAEKPPEEGNALFSAYVVRQRSKHFIRQHRAISAKNYPRTGRMPTDKLNHTLHFVECRHDEIDADVVVAPASNFLQKLALRWIVKHD